MHPYDATCYCPRCNKERLRRAAQSARYNLPRRKHRACSERRASREEQHARYLDCGPQAWDDYPNNDKE